MTQGFSTLSDTRLRDLAGSGAFERGAAYFKQGRVEFASCDPQRTMAVVHGSEDYRVKLQCPSSGPFGTCDCPAFDRTDFCKHMVAVAMASRHRIGSGSGAGVDRLKAAADFLRSQGLEAAIARLLQVAESDSALLAQIEQDAADLGEDDAVLTRRYRQLIDEVTAIEGYVDYRGARAYAEDIGAMLDRLETLSAQGRAGVVVDLCIHLLEAMDEVFEAVDDSDGEIGAVVARGSEIHLAACQAAAPDPIDLAGWLFERELNSDWYVFEGRSEAYGDMLGAVGTAELRRLARDAWAARSKADGGHHALMALLDRFAREDGDLDARIDLRKADLSRPHAFIEIAKLCVEAGRDDQALTWLRDGVWIFEDRPDVRLVLMAASLEAKVGRPVAAADILWAAFERSPDLTLFAELKRLEPEIGPVVDRAIAKLEVKGASHLLFDLLLAEGLFDAAWKAADRHAIDERRLERLADLSRDSHRQRAIDAYDRLAECRIVAGAGNYDAAVDLIRRRGLACGDAVAQAAYIEAIRLRHRAKRTLVSRLSPLF
ncbi:SWIM zinc finger family protein [soil metagenome]